MNIIDKMKYELLNEEYIKEMADKYTDPSKAFKAPTDEEINNFPIVIGNPIPNKYIEIENEIQKNYPDINPSTAQYWVLVKNTCKKQFPEEIEYHGEKIVINTNSNMPIRIVRKGISDWFNKIDSLASLVAIKYLDKILENSIYKGWENNIYKNKHNISNGKRDREYAYIFMCVLKLGDLYCLVTTYVLEFQDESVQNFHCLQTEKITVKVLK